MMTRSLNNRPDSPKGKYSCIGEFMLYFKLILMSLAGSQPSRVADGGICKRQPLSPTQRSIKVLTKDLPTQQECIAQLKRLLPKVDEEEKMSELDLVERTIAYISYLENLLQATSSNSEVSHIHINSFYL
jgi:hypothetical protein